MKRAAVLLIALAAAGCASAPPAPAVKSGPTFDQKAFELKMASILRLEDRRVLRDPAPVVAALAPVPAPVARGQRPQPVATPPPPPPDVIRLLSDDEARIRRRAALAIGHVGLADGVTPLLGALGDQDPEVRQMAAFALGLLGDRRAREPLASALADASPLVQGSAALSLSAARPLTANARG